MYSEMDGRIDFISRWAQSNGFSFDIADPDDEVLSLPLHFLDGLYRSVWNVVRGEWKAVPVEAFDLMLGRSDVGYSISTCALTAMPMNSPEMLVTHRSLVDSVSDLLVPRIGTESAAFDDEWEIRCTDHSFANAVIHQRMMEWLLGLGDRRLRTSFELGGPWCLAITEALREEEFEIALDDLTSFVTLVPHFVTDLYPLPG